MKPGDWTCPACNDLQFARNPVCRRCGSARPAAEPGSAQAFQPPAPQFTGPAMSAPQFAGAFAAGACGICGKTGHPTESCWHRPGGACELCGKPGHQADTCWHRPGALPLDSNGLQMRPGDWNCPTCGDHVFAKNSVCRRCGTANPSGPSVAAGPYARAGDWACPNCHDVQFSRNNVCRKCGTSKPAEGAVATMALAPPAGIVVPPPGSANAVSLAMGTSVAGGAAGAGCQVCGKFGHPSEACWHRPGALPLDANGRPIRPGDWTCPVCSDHQFAKNSNCRQCGTARPDANALAPPAAANPIVVAPATSPVMMQPCALAPATGFGACPGYVAQPAMGSGYTMQPTIGYGAVSCVGHPAVAGAAYSSPYGAVMPQVQVSGDWICTACGDLQFARNDICRRCGAAKPLAAMAGTLQTMPLQQLYPMQQVPMQQIGLQPIVYQQIPMQQVPMLVPPPPPPVSVQHVPMLVPPPPPQVYVQQACLQQVPASLTDATAACQPCSVALPAT